MNRHYMKLASPARLAAEGARFFQTRGFLKRKTDIAMAYVESLLPMAVGSVDRLEEIPDRLGFLFEYDVQGALQRAAVAEILHEPGAREVIGALAAAIEGPLLDRDAFRAGRTAVKERRDRRGGALSPDPPRATGEGAALLDPRAGVSIEGAVVVRGGLAKI